MQSNKHILIFDFFQRSIMKAAINSQAMVYIWEPKMIPFALLSFL